jgi:hypothetical protein
MAMMFELFPTCAYDVKMTSDSGKLAVSPAFGRSPWLLNVGI